ncbi:hypothetical protein MMC25_000177 [Agyrium rufum]|nr:hypothetical protein [Agyrium rufum]
MAENIPPSNASDQVRGLPYYEKLKRDLHETIHKKRVLDKNLAALEEQIYRFEGTYLEETGAGNIIKGFENYIKGSTATTAASAGGGTSTRRKGNPVDHDRVFSRSSASFMKQDSPPPSSSQTTPGFTPSSNGPTPLSARDSNQPTPTSAASHKATANTKKTKKAVVEKEEDDGDGKPAKRLKITYARGEKGGD